MRKENLNEKMLNQLTRALKAIEPISFVKYICQSCFFCPNRCKNERLKKYKKVMMRSQSKLMKELDLQKFIFRQRLQTTAILALLKGRQCFIVDKMSELVI